MPSAAVQEKAARLLAEQRVRLVPPLTLSRVEAQVRGDSGDYTVALDKGGWFCDCEARGTCSHLYAVRDILFRSIAGAIGKRDDDGNK